MSELLPPLADSLFLGDKSRVVNTPSWVAWFSKVTKLLVNTPAVTVNNAVGLTIAAGDLLVGSGVNVLSVLSKGTANQKLFMNAGATTEEWASGTYIGTFTRAMDADTGDVSYTGTGFKPSFIIFLSSLPTKSQSIGFAGSSHNYTVMIFGTSANYQINSTVCIWDIESSGKEQVATVKTYDANGFTLTWTKNSTPASATATHYYMAFR